MADLQKTSQIVAQVEYLGDAKQKVSQITAQVEVVPPGPKAKNPDPSDGATDVPISQILSWAAPGLGADSYDVYFGDSAPGTFQGNQAGLSFNPGTLNYSQEYFWRIDPTLSGVSTTGDVWSFITVAAPASSSSGMILCVPRGDASRPIGMAISVSGQPAASLIVMIPIPANMTVTIPAGMTNSVGRAGAAATAEAQIDVKKNGSSVGTIAFAAADCTATFTMSSDTILDGSSGDYLSLEFPSSQDATLADVGIVIAGTRS